MTQVEHITPYGSHGDERNKGEQVRDMFNNIAPAYDRMNRLMTMGVDRKWRQKCVGIAKDFEAKKILDLATGTGDMALEMAKEIPDALIIGADLAEGMLAAGREKATISGLGDRVDFQQADALNLPFGDNMFDVVTIAFGVRNFEHLDRGYSEMLRVLRPGGRLVVLELTEPSSWIIRPFYKIYTRGIIPLIGKMVSKDNRAYAYLPESIAAVPAREEMTRLMEKVGFRNARWKNLTFGVANLYTAHK